MASKSRGGLSKREYAAKQSGTSVNYGSGSKSSGGSSGSSSGAPKLPSMPDFKFDSSKLVPQYQQEANSLFQPQLEQIKALRGVTTAQAEDAKVKTNDDFAQLLKRETENINRRGAFFSGGAIDQENRIGAEQGRALRDINNNLQIANIDYSGREASIGQGIKDYVSSKVEGAYSSAYKMFQDTIANSLSLYDREASQYNTDRTFNQSKLESDRNYALSAAASGRASAAASGINPEIKAVSDASAQFGGDWQKTADYLAAKGYDTGPGTTIDNELRRRNGLAPLNSGLSTQTQTTVRGIAGNFDNEQQVKNFQQVQSANGKIQSIDNGTKNPADNQALIYAFAKAMDPNSVVREGEYATVQKYAQSWADTQGFNAARILANKEFLTEQAVQNIKDTVQRTYDTEKAAYENVYNEYGRRIDQQTGGTNGKEYLTNYSIGSQTNKNNPNDVNLSDEEAFKLYQQGK